ncbi:amidophosphoribosyltransferase [Pseudothermotoga sp.]|nr:amidophosphoribosyltransferase [Pseudothermotoga sp.]MCX7813449.1 amidophosphoribosyltransferase [Pseudothermotoga sp.]MDW8139563.1 amidophosphoribosyltransferase [Pseudothermotoga sp.]
MKEACGLFGIFSPSFDPKISKLVYYGLIALQHRGQESAGIAVSDGRRIKFHKGLGLVNEVFNEEILDELSGQLAVGHVRYSTTGSNLFDNAQPIVVEWKGKTIAVVHNGNLVNAKELRTRMTTKHITFRTTTDSELLALQLLESQTDLAQACLDLMNIAKGAYCLLIMDDQRLLAVRDPKGFRPLCMGSLNDRIVFASETVALDTVGAKFIREIEPGEVVVVDKDGLETLMIDSSTESFCIFEFVYFARPDSFFKGKSVYSVREMAGRLLAMEQPVEADIVVGVPDSGTIAAIGYASQSGINYGMGLIKNRYVGRTFIQPSQKLRSLGVKLKLNALKDLVKDKRVVLVDDSIVRGTTMSQIVQMLKDVGAKSVHVRIASPPIRYSCYFGVDTSDRRELVASVLAEKEIERMIGADSLGYLSMEGLLKATGMSREHLCLACFDGSYPVEVPCENTKYLFEKG